MSHKKPRGTTQRMVWASSVALALSAALAGSALAADVSPHPAAPHVVTPHLVAVPPAAPDTSSSGEPLAPSAAAVAPSGGTDRPPDSGPAGPAADPANPCRGNSCGPAPTDAGAGDAGSDGGIDGIEPYVHRLKCAAWKLLNDSILDYFFEARTPGAPATPAENQLGESIIQFERSCLTTVSQ